MNDTAPTRELVAKLEAENAELKQRVQQLAERERHLRAILDAEPECVKSLAADGTLLEMNQAGLKMIEAESDEQVIGCCIYPLVAAEHRGSFQALTELVFRGQSGSLEFEVVGLKGGRRWLETHATPLRDDSGNIVSLLSVTRDISERKRTEESLRESNGLLAYSQSQARIGSWKYSFATQTATWSAEMFRIHGRDVSHGPPTLAEIFDSVHPEDRQSIETAYADALANRSGSHLDYRVVRPDGSIFWAASHWEMNFDDTGQFVGLTGTLQDITDRKRVEETLQASEAQLTADLDAMIRLQKVGTLFVEKGDLRPVLDEVLATAIAMTDADMGNIQLLDAQSHFLRIVAQQGFEQPFLDFWNTVHEGEGACGTALRDGGRVLIEDVTQSPIFAGKPALDVMLQAGVRAVQSTLLRSRTGRVLGIFSTHFRTPRRPDERALRLLDLLARQTADILERAEAEATLRESEERFRIVFEKAAYAAVLSRLPGGNIEQVNEAFERLFGYGRQEVIGRTSLELGIYSAEVREQLIAEFQAHGRLRDWEMIMRVKSGESRIVLSNCDFVEFGGERYALSIVTDITERRQAEQALRESDQRLRLAVSAANVGLWDWDLKTNKVYFSAEWKRQIGYEEHEIRNDFSEWQSRVHPDDLERALDTVRRYLANPWPNYVTEFRLRHKDGSYRWILTQASLQFGDDGQPVRMLGSHVDITDRKQAEELLRQSEEFNRRIVESSYDCVKVLDLDGTLLSMSEGGQRLLEITDITPYLNQCWIDFWKESDQPEVREAVAAGRAGNIGHFQAFCPSATGEPRWWDVIISAIRDATGQPCQLLSISRDITERHQAEARLHESNRRFATIFHASPVGNCITRFADGVFLDVNEAFAKITGHTREELLGRSSLDVTYWLDPEDRAKLVQALVDNGSVRDWEIGFRRKDGSLGHSLRSLERLTLDGEDCILTALSDITDRKLNEEELRVSRERLETLSRQLIATQESERRHLARELHDEIGQELTSIKLNLRNLQQVSSNGADLVIDTLAIAEHALQQVRSLALDLRPSMLDDIGLAAALRWCLGRQALRSGFVPLFLAEPPELAAPPEVTITCFRVAQECLTNIARHAQARNVRVEVRQYESAIDLQVHDDGIGFDVTAATDQATHGASLGLLGMRERAELVGGLIDIESTPNSGTTIHARFPLAGKRD